MKNSQKLLSLVLSLALLVCACMPVAFAEIADGVYTGTGIGMHSEIVVNVTVADGKIADVEIVSQDETVGISDPAFAKIPAAIVAANSPDVDVIASATFTSNGIMSAVRNALNGETAAQTENDAFEPDMIIIGAGFAGMTAAVRCAQLGIKALVLEESARIGGALNYAGGTISGANYKIQRDFGVEDTAEAFYNDIVAIGGGEDKLNAELAKAHAEKSGAAIDWLDEYVGADFGTRSLFGGWYAQFETLRVTLSLDDPNLFGGKGFLEPLTAKFEQGVADGYIKLMLNTAATELVADGDTITAVKAGEAEYTAPVVLLSTGGYSHNLELLQKGGFEKMITAGPSTCNGSGHLMALQLGGVLDNFDNHYSYHSGGVPSNGFDMTTRVNASYAGIVYVDVNGQRVGNEDAAPLSMWTNAPENTLYGIVCADTINPETVFMRAASSAYPAFANNGWDKLEELAAIGECVFKADTIEELAALMGLEALPETIRAYNADAAQGVDTKFGRSAAKMVALENGPFYAVTTVPYVYTAVTGGVRANAQGQLARADGSAYENLYLAGEIMGPTNISGEVTFGGLDHALCVIWGLNAADAAAAAAAK